MKTLLLSALVAGFAGLVALIGWPSQAPASGPPTVDEVAQELMRDFAQSMKTTIQTLMDEEKSKDEILSYFVAELGDDVLAMPKMPAPSLSAANVETTGIIEGTVTNGSEGGGSVTDLEVVVTVWQPDGQESEEHTTRTDSSGAFRFEGLPVSEDLLYLVSMRYQGVEYYRSDILLTSDQPQASTQVMVYEPTSSAEAIKVVTDHLALEVNENGRWLEVMSNMRFANEGDRTYAGQVGADPAGPAQTLHFSLPAEAMDLELHQGLWPDTIVITDSTDGTDAGFADTQPVLPGETEITFAYRLPYSSDEYLLRQELTYFTDKVILALPAGVEVQSAQLPESTQVETGGRNFTVISGESLPAGIVLEIALSGLPQDEDSLLSSGDIVRPAVVVLVILALGVAVGYPFLRRRFATPSGRDDR